MNYTIEAAILMPLLLFTIVAGIRISIQMYKEVGAEREQAKVESLWLVDDFYKYQVKEVIDDK